MTEEKEKTARRRSSGVHVEETRPVVLPTVHTRNESGQRVEVTQTVYPGTMPSTGKPSSISKAPAQAKPVEVEIVTEAKVLEIARSNIYNDEAFLRFLEGLIKKTNKDTQEYLRELKREISFLTVKTKEVNGLLFREIVMVTENKKLWHLNIETLKKLKYTEVSIILELIEKHDKNCELLFNDLKMDQPQRLPEVITQPWIVL